MDNFIFIYKKRIDLKNSNRLIIQTGSCKDYMKDVKAVSYVNGVETPVDIVENVHTPLLFVYKNAEPEFDGEYNFCIDLPKRSIMSRLFSQKILTHPEKSEYIYQENR